MSLSLTLIGTGAVRANPARGGPGQLLELPDGRRLLFDCGRCTVGNLARLGFAAESVSHVFLTHLHFDHVCDLPYLVLLSWNNGRAGPLPVYGPPGTGEFLEHAVRAAYARDIGSRVAHGKSLDGLEWTVRTLAAEGTIAAWGNVEISVLRSSHAGLHNLNYRIDLPGRRIGITSDTEPDPRFAEFYRNADLLVCECSGTSAFLGDKPWGGWHMTPERVAALVNDAAVREVVLKHFVVEDFPGGEGAAEAMAESVRRLTGAEVIAGCDGFRWSADDV
ncbi:MAG: MBL fold metallo-hydrolase [Kiritimatiellaeota bacterium]|nr:MBL fold metallo-hydrolase [Kiritimatiellota bacterium]